ncbi:hypothetical protein BDN70DRAFT_936079 [Pholiota conissans]|uniref:Uncharacterized protein n=1 Tax=Pholiota conissans TaxID=109636 RepID=A0A9P5YTB2_9AGAR|nr:hypothetical protein BDN70DRAFT_936079 [Pholiota conissans]
MPAVRTRSTLRYGNFESLQPSMTMFSNASNFTISDSKITQVMGDYHFHANKANSSVNDSMNYFCNCTNTHNANESNANACVQPSIQVIDGVYHHHVHHHYPPPPHSPPPQQLYRRASYLSKHSKFDIEVKGASTNAPHYHIYRGGGLMFCTRSSGYQKLGLPTFPFLENMKLHARIVLEHIDAGTVYDDMGGDQCEHCGQDTARPREATPSGLVLQKSFHLPGPGSPRPFYDSNGLISIYPGLCQYRFNHITNQDHKNVYNLEYSCILNP